MRRLVATHQLDDDVDVVVGHQVRRRVGQDRAGHPRGGGAPDVAHGDGGELEGCPIGRLQLPGTIDERAHDLPPDGSRAEHADAQPGAAHDGVRAGRDIGPNGSRPVGATAG